MKLIILVASKRRKGNSAIVAKLLEKYAPKYSIISTTLYLDDYNLLECDGCMRCVFKGIKCHLEDDFYSLIEKITESDMFVLIAPTYVFSIPGTLKTFLDRFLLFPPYYKRNSGKQGGSIGIASLTDWEHLQLPFLNTILLSLGFDVVDSFMLFGAGPGEVLLDDKFEKKVECMLIKLRNKRKLTKTRISDKCPVCFSRIFEYTDGLFICPFCGTKANQTVKGLLFNYEDIKNHRFTAKNLNEHFENWILKTKDMFRKNLKEVIRRKREIFRERKEG